MSETMKTKVYTHICKVCEKTYKDTLDEPYWCSDCDNEFADWLDEKGYEVGVFDDKSNPGYIAEPYKGTKWERMNS